jgi:hypothetical protein
VLRVPYRGRERIKRQELQGRAFDAWLQPVMLNHGHIVSLRQRLCYPYDGRFGAAQATVPKDFAVVWRGTLRVDKGNLHARKKYCMIAWFPAVGQTCLVRVARQGARKGDRFAMKAGALGKGSS